MEQIPPVPPEGTSLFEMELDATAQNHLNTISKWGKFISITGLICVALLLLALAARYKEFAAIAARLFAFGNSTAGILIVVLVIFGAMGILLLVSLLRACALIKQGLVSQNADRIADGFKSLKVVFTISIIFSTLTILSTVYSLTTN